MSYTMFLGCTIPVRGQNYEISARKVAETLGLELTDPADFACCGFPTKSTDTFGSLLLAARNLAVAAEHGGDVVTLCNSCGSVLREANEELTQDTGLRDRVNAELKKVGREFIPGVRIRHFSRMLLEDVGEDAIRERVTRPLSGLRISAHYGCHYMRPKQIHSGFEDPEDPQTLERLIAIAGAEPVDYMTKLDCCGGAILAVDEDIALRMAKKKLDELHEKGVDALISTCPFCSVMYEDNQRKIETTYDVEYNLPVMFFTQLLGLSFGLDQKELGFRLNKVKAKDLLAKLEGGE